MERQSIYSSALASAGYDSSLEIMEVEFNTGEIYQYKGIPQSEYEAFLNADSHGIYFSENIKDAYEFVKL